MYNCHSEESKGGETLEIHHNFAYSLHLASCTVIGFGCRCGLMAISFFHFPISCLTEKTLTINSIFKVSEGLVTDVKCSFANGFCCFHYWFHFVAYLLSVWFTWLCGAIACWTNMKRKSFSIVYISKSNFVLKSSLRWFRVIIFFPVVQRIKTRFFRLWMYYYCWGFSPASNMVSIWLVSHFLNYKYSSSEKHTDILLGSLEVDHVIYWRKTVWFQIKVIANQIQILM